MARSSRCPDGTGMARSRGQVAVASGTLAEVTGRESSFLGDIVAWRRSEIRQTMGVASR